MRHPASRIMSRRLDTPFGAARVPPPGGCGTHPISGQRSARHPARVRFREPKGGARRRAARSQRRRDRSARVDVTNARGADSRVWAICRAAQRCRPAHLRVRDGDLLRGSDGRCRRALPLHRGRRKGRIADSLHSAATHEIGRHSAAAASRPGGVAHRGACSNTAAPPRAPRPRLAGSGASTPGGDRPCLCVGPYAIVIQCIVRTWRF
jgi:hypothetical protein